MLIRSELIFTPLDLNPATENLETYSTAQRGCQVNMGTFPAGTLFSFTGYKKGINMGTFPRGTLFSFAGYTKV